MSPVNFPEEDVNLPEAHVQMEFSGTPAKYLKLSIWLNVGLTLYLYFGMVILAYICHGETWIFSWQPITIAIIFAIFTSRFTYTRIMGLDGQYGTGKGWEHPSGVMKLPRRRQHKNKSPSA